MKTEYVPFSVIEQFLDGVKKQFCNVKFCGVYGISKGGIVVASMVAVNLNLPLLSTPCKDCLIVDDVSETGKTLRIYQEKGYKIATVYWNQNSSVTPDFYVAKKHPDSWILFPWQREN